jgi:site-specific recombinase
VKSKFVEAYNKLMVDKTLLIENTKSIIELLTDTSKIDATIQKLNEELNDVRILVENLIKDNASRTQNQIEYTNRYKSLNEKYNLTKEKIEEAIIKRNEMQQKADSLKCFLKELTDKPSLIETYDSILWNSMLDEAIVNEDGTIQFKFKGGKEITL